MDAPLTGHALQPLGQLDDLLGVGVLGVELAELLGLAVALVGGVEDALDGDVLALDGRGHGLGEPVADGVGVAHDATGVLQGLLGLDDAVGDHLADAVGAVLLAHVLNDLVTPALVEVDVDIGHGDALGVEEALEDESVAQRVELGDAHGVGDHGAGSRSTPRSHPDAVGLGPVDVVGHDEEVAGEPHLGDDADLVLGLLAAVLGDVAVEPAVHAAPALLDEPGLVGLPLGDGEGRHVGGPLVHGAEVHVALLGHEQGVVACLGHLGEEAAHLGAGAQVVGVTVELEAIRIGEHGAGVDAQHRVLDGAVLGAHVVGVVGGQQRGPNLLGDAQQILGDALLDLQAVVHELDVEELLAEDVLQLPGDAQGLVPLAQAQAGLDLRGGAAGGADEAARVAREQLAVDTRRLAPLALQGGEGVHAHEVVQALVVA